MSLVRSLPLFAALVPALLLAAPGCGNSDKPYEPQPAYSGKPVQLPDVPTLASKPIKVGDAYTVHGATHHLRSIVHVKDVKNKDLSIIGYIVKTNFDQAPKCAVHPTGKADPDDCKPPVPAIWIADEAGETKHMIKVMGFASNFAQLYDAIERDKTSKDTPRTVTDEFLGVPLPQPVPNVGAKIKVTGNYGYAYTKATSGIETDPRNGILTYEKIEYIEKPPTPATLPGMK